jgi:ABC-type nitrate/sulfonate/bicarbonate transport system permease component
VLVATELADAVGDPGLGSFVGTAGLDTGDLVTVLAAALWTGVLGCAMALLLGGLRRDWHDRLSLVANRTDAVRSRRWTTAVRWIAIGVMVVVWQGITMAVRSPLAPTPVRIARDAWQLLPDPATWSSLGDSLVRLAEGWGLAVVLGVVGGILLGLVPRLADIAEPPAALIRTIPPTLLLPIEYAWLRIGTPLVVATITVGAVWPVLLTTIDGVRGVDRTTVDTARIYRRGRLRRIATVVVPAAAPRILTGLRMSLALSVVLMVIAELTGGASSGIGYQLDQTQSSFDYPSMWVWIVVIGAIGFAGSWLLERTARPLVAWHHDLDT